MRQDVYAILLWVQHYTCIAPEMLLGRTRRTKSVMRARHIALAAVREGLELSWKELGAEFGCYWQTARAGAKNGQRDPRRHAVVDQVLSGFRGQAVKQLNCSDGNPADTCEPIQQGEQACL